MLNPQDKYIVVNYHYVRDPDPKWPGIHPCPVAEFDRQVGFLVKNFKVVSIEEVHQAAKEERPGKFCAITFDDGLMDNYENALPILEKYKTFGTFFIITRTLRGLMPIPHKLHVLFSMMSPVELIDMFNEWANGKYVIPKDKAINNRRNYGDFLTNNLKEAMILVGPALRDGFINHCFKQKNLDEAKLTKEFFVSPEIMMDMVKKGMILENHSDEHTSFEVLSLEEAKKDLELSKKSLEEILKKDIKIFSFPHGRYSKDSLEVLRATGFEYAVTTDRRAITKNDDSLLIPRFDANDLKIV